MSAPIVEHVEHQENAPDPRSVFPCVWRDAEDLIQGMHTLERLAPAHGFPV